VLERDGRRFTIRPEKLRLLDDDETPDPGDEVEAGRIEDVVYAGSITRTIVALERGGTLIVVRQNLESSSTEAAEARGRTTRVAWRAEQAYAITEKEEA
jgi:putative spermidine/putrescine transport system ATP-binding protein